MWQSLKAVGIARPRAQRSGATAHPQHSKISSSATCGGRSRKSSGLKGVEIIILEPISICREFARLGKPQIFFAGLIDVTFDELTVSIRKAHGVAQSRGFKREALIHPIFHYPRGVIKRMHKLQARGTDIARLAASFTCDDLFGRRGFTTECVANLYYANLALPFLISEMPRLSIVGPGEEGDRHGRAR